jgi:ABC-type hemin transport system ATPase subunit
MQVNPHNPDLMQVASQAQNMAKIAQQERMAFAFQSVAMVSMAIMGIAATAHLIRELLRSETPGRGR